MLLCCQCGRLNLDAHGSEGWSCSGPDSESRRQRMSMGTHVRAVQTMACDTWKLAVMVSVRDGVTHWQYRMICRRGRYELICDGEGREEGAGEGTWQD